MEKGTIIHNNMSHPYLWGVSYIPKFNITLCTAHLQRRGGSILKEGEAPLKLSFRPYLFPEGRQYL